MVTRRMVPIATLTALVLTSFLAVPATAVDEPFVTTFVMQGRIACSVGFLTVSTVNLCASVGLDPNGNARFGLIPPTGAVTGAVFEVEWTPTSIFGAECLALRYPAVIAEGATLTTDDRLAPGFVVRGSSPIGLTIEATDLADPIYQPHGGPMTFEVRAAGANSDEFLADPVGTCQSGLVVEQSFTLYVSLFYFGAAVPPGFTHLA